MAITTQRAEVQTTDGTQTPIWTSPTALTSGFIVYVFAEEPATADQQIWAFHCGRSDNDNSVIQAALHAQAGDPGGSGWVVEIVEGTDALEVNVQGEAAHTINWVANIQRYD